MIVVVASASDAPARELQQQWSGHDVRLLTAADLSTPGWSATLPSSGRSTAVIQGEATDSREISGVLTRLPSIGTGELGHIAAAERPYVAAEMNAFLLWWLSDLACPVVNRPMPPRLCGPAWRPERWCTVAARLGVPVEPIHRVAAGPDRDHGEPDVSSVVTVVGSAGIGDVDALLADRARRLAAAASADLLRVTFSGTDGDARFAGAHPDADLSDERVRDAVLELLERR